MCPFPQVGYVSYLKPKKKRVDLLQEWPIEDQILREGTRDQCQLICPYHAVAGNIDIFCWVNRSKTPRSWISLS